MRVVWLLLFTLLVPFGTSPLIADPANATWDAHPTPTDGELDKIQIIIPFYEGIMIDDPCASLPSIGLQQFELSYPGPMSAPLAAWRFQDGPWTLILADSLDAIPIAFDLDAKKNSLELKLKAMAPCKFLTLKVDGDWKDVALAARKYWEVKKRHEPLASRFDRVEFLVHQWVADQPPPLRTDWSIEQLCVEMRRTSDRALVHIYGWDPGGIDLGGRYFWSEGSQADCRKVIAANPKVSQLAWLNLRTYKTAIPRLGIELTPPDEDHRTMARVDTKGVMTETGAFDATDMCLASEGWQQSRLEQFDRLAAAGFKVVQIDEFPIAAPWHIDPCLAKNHLHRPADPVDEWSYIRKFLIELSQRADKAGVLLTCEEPSAALLPYVCGYIDRQYNNSIDIYGKWTQSPKIKTVPFFSEMFHDICTPYTDADELNPARTPPTTWLEAHKHYPAK